MENYIHFSGEYFLVRIVFPEEVGKNDGKSRNENVEQEDHQESEPERVEVVQELVAASLNRRNVDIRYGLARRR